MRELLRTERLALRPVSMRDHRPLLAHWTRPPVRRHLFGDAAVSAVQVTEIIAASRRDFASLGYGLWTLRPVVGAPVVGAPAAGEPLVGDPLVGVAGLTGRDGPGAGVEIVYSLEPESWGEGLAAEASRAVLDYAFGVVGLRRVAAEIDPDSAVSMRVAERLGMRPVPDGRAGPDGASFYAADRSGWTAARLPAEGVDAVRPVARAVQVTAVPVTPAATSAG
ncbi:GNAT family N-acetyltransferase [Actinomadura sp. WMMB 499]|uniref:GNAT family N-acetyltransferase n=1 Tax=Actinomadura sp. WMMB 499 TaxID=1219491 RepID=UPI0012491E1F|nr:GNAT family protein [Actinomadura sp. WMMB 499]QFG20021.1 GNAT family N-acetyltransferase [Actinomadura sp. WMMB 499]